MAFNPFSSFRKNTKFWMAAVTLLCMITFVLCTGVGGDLADRLLKLFGGNRGSLLATVDGRNLYLRDFDELKAQRQLANRYMRKSCELAIHNIERQLKNLEKQSLDDKSRQMASGHLRLMAAVLAKRLERPQYFGTGTKLDELVDFATWRARADRLDIRLTDKGVDEIFYRDILTHAGNENTTFFFQPHKTEVYWEVRQNFQGGVTYNHVMDALREELRVRIAQLATVGAQTEAYLDPSVRLERHMDQRTLLSPLDLWEHHKKNCSSVSIDLVPVLAQDFVKEVAQPTDKDLKDLFEERKKLKFDPTSPKSGFEIPQRIKVEWISADADLPFYRNPAKAALALLTVPPAWNPGGSAIALATRYGAGPLALESALDRNYQVQRRFLDSYDSAPLNEPDFIGPLLGRVGKPTPALAAALVAHQPNPASTVIYQSVLYKGHEKELAPFIEAEVKRRLPYYATLVSTAAAGDWMLLRQVLEEGARPQFLPLSLVRSDFEKQLVTRIASGWVRKNMGIARKALEKLERQEGIRKDAFEELVSQYEQEFGLRRQSTAGFYNRFTIAQAAELQPLRDAFAKVAPGRRTRYLDEINQYEARVGDRMLREDDFARLFFESQEPHGVARAKYQAKPWPPDVTPKLPPGMAPGIEPPVQYLFKDAPKPFLFWKTEEEHTKIPERLEEVKDRVELAWKIDKSRDQFALPRAKDIAEKLQTVGDVSATIRSESAKLGREPIKLPRVAPLVPEPVQVFQGRFARDYVEYRLPADEFEYARDDTVKNLLALADLKKPIEIGDKRLDEVNKKLFDAAKGADKHVQILTNKPQTAFYVGTVVFAPGPSRLDFELAYKRAYAADLDLFTRKAHQDLGKELRTAALDQLRREFSVVIHASAEDRRHFDTESPDVR